MKKNMWATRHWDGYHDWRRCLFVFDPRHHSHIRRDVSDQIELEVLRSVKKMHTRQEGPTFVDDARYILAFTFRDQRMATQFRKRIKPVLSKYKMKLVLGRLQCRSLGW